MNKSPIIILLVIVLFFTNIPIALSAEENPCYSVNSLSLNKTICDRNEVEITGEVVNLKFTISANGHKYTTFNFNEGNETVTIFSYGYIPVEEKDRVTVKGTYYTNYLYENYSFINRIQTQPSNILILSKRINRIIIYTCVTIIFLLILISLFIYKLYRQKNKKKVNYVKGHKFENYALSLFLEPKQWEIEHLSADLSEEIGRKVNEDSNPDIIVKHKTQKLIFALECKYRSNFFRGKSQIKMVSWAKDYQLEHYQKFQEENNLPTYIFIGIGGFPSKPERTFLIPLNSLRYSSPIKEEYLKYFEKKVNESFMVEESTLK